MDERASLDERQLEVSKAVRLAVSQKDIGEGHSQHPSSINLDP